MEIKNIIERFKRSVKAFQDLKRTFKNEGGWCDLNILKYEDCSKNRDENRSEKFEVMRRSINKKIEIEKIKRVEEGLENIRILIDFLIENKDEDFLNEAFQKISEVQSKIEDIRLIRLFSKKNDFCNCYIDLQSGSGGIDSQDWTNMLMRMYLKWAGLKKFRSHILDISYGELTGIKSSTLMIQGKYAYGWLRTETGIHRLVRKSPFDSSGRRHTSFSSVFVYPEISDDKNQEIEIKSHDLRIESYRSSGAGGQHTNKTESAIRITHIPTGIVTQCQNDRSQHRNKEHALRQLRNKLCEIKEKEKQENQKIIENSKFDITWGHQIRSYVLDHSRVKDLRTGTEDRNVQSILNGKIDKFIIANLNKENIPL
ncbi:peptide chain release factor 2 [Candidatus Riesia pediculischaeffi]|uniref:peptide chain release factor 2 n=1 Tax=Candidatus Riesia pediculischaeffi TaxID=428411 RepID=UPI0009B7C1CD|nr:peptide chain release factor 2 [Candidatus Riesia pediculischaeffi]